MASFFCTGVGGSPLKLFLLSIAFAALHCQAQNKPQQFLLALSKADHTLAILDAASLKVVGKVPVGSDPHEVIASDDGKTAYVTIYGGGSLHEINVIDLVNLKALTTIDTRPLYGPHGIVFVNGKAWFSAEGSKAVGSYDPATNKIDWSMGTGQDRTHMIYVTPDARKIYTTNIASGTVSIFEEELIQPGKQAPPGAKPHPDWRHTIVPTARGSEGLDVSKNGKELWTASAEDGSITIVNLENKTQAARIPAKVFGANRLKFTPDGKMAFISSLQNGELTIYDTKTRKELKSLKLGKGAAGIEMDPDNTRAFVACSADNNIAIIDLKTLEVTSRIEVGGTPDGMAWAIQRQ